MEKVDDVPSYGQVPGTDAYNMRTEDAAPDVLAVIPEDEANQAGSRPIDDERHSLQGESPIPTTVVEKVDPSTPSHGDVPGTAAHDIRKADAVPDIIMHAGERSTSSPSFESRRTNVPIPRTIVTRVDSSPAHGEVPGTDAYRIREADATPDVIEKKKDVPSKYSLPAG